MGIEHVEPARCTLWQFHERFADELSCGSSQELITSIQRHGQRHPALGRRVAQGSGATIELIYGARRLFAAAQLGVNLVVDVRDLDDREAIVEMEIENRLRTDISPYERGMSYRRWLNAGLFASQAELAKELGLSEAQTSRLLRYADLPAAVVGAFDNVQSIREEWAVALARICQDSSRRPGVLRRAREIAQGARRDRPQMVFRRLLSSGRLARREAAQAHDEVVKNATGKPIYRIAVRAKAVHFIIPRDGMSEELMHELKRQLASTLEAVADGRSSGWVLYPDRTNHPGAYGSIVSSQ